MEKYYSVLVVTEELRKSPALSMYGRFHDVVVNVGSEQVVTFLLPIYVETRKLEDICVLFDPDLIEVLDATVQTHSNDVRVFTHVSVRMVGRDIGSSSIGFASPEHASHQLGGVSAVSRYHIARSA